MNIKAKKRVASEKTDSRQKIWWILGTIILILIIIFLLYQVHPQASPDMSDTSLPGFEGDKETIDKGLDTAGNVKEGLTDEEKRNETTNYLKQEWGKILRKNQYLAPFFAFWDIASPIVNPIFNLLLGVEISFSWLFILILALCVLFFMYTRAILLGFSSFSKTGSTLIATGFLVMFAITRVIKMIAEYIISILSLFSKWYVQLIAIVIIIIAISLGSYLSKYIKEYKRKKKMEEGEQAAEQLKTHAEIARDYAKKVISKSKS